MVTIGLVVLAWAVVGIFRWVGYQLVQQNGLILLHLDSLHPASGRTQTDERTGPPGRTSHARWPFSRHAYPAFELPDLSQHPIKLADWQGRRLLPIFFNRACRFCQPMAPDIAALPIDDPGKPLPVLVTSNSKLPHIPFLVGDHGVPLLLGNAITLGAIELAHT